MPNKSKENKIEVVELFAGVGGFRVGLERASERFEIVWSNQFEPSTKVQHASDVYVRKFGPKGHENKNISEIPVSEIPNHDVLVGGFPCQDYSVARTLNHAKGLHGKKGVLWWEIHRIVEAKQPSYLFLENVDRLLKSPANQRGRDFAIMLASLSDLGYAVEWRVINAADYGMPQRRRRVFILAYRQKTDVYKTILKKILKTSRPFAWIQEEGLLAQAFPVDIRDFGMRREFSILGELEDISESFRTSVVTNLSDRLPIDDYVYWESKSSPFENSGLLFPENGRRVGEKERQVWTIKTKPFYSGPHQLLGDILADEDAVPLEYYINGNLERWKYLKAAKNEQRRNKATGFEYQYTEGPLPFPDPLERASRTVITGEGGATPSRFKHVIQRNENGPYRRLTPIELERLNMFPDNHTEGVSDVKRAFFMGNALVVGIVERIGKSLAHAIKED